MAFRILAGYEQQVGAKIEMFVDVDGPTSYNNTGTFGTSGQQINASDLGVGGFEAIYPVTDIVSDGVYSTAIALGATTAGGTAGAAPPAGSPGPAFTTAVLHWYTTPQLTTEVTNGTNISTKWVRLYIRAV